MITILNIAKSYNGNVVVNIPSLEIAGGEIIGLVGNNGAGKTTLFRLVLDLGKATLEVFDQILHGANDLPIHRAIDDHPHFIARGIGRGDDGQGFRLRA